MNLGTTFHTRVDSQAEHTIQTLEEMVRSSVIDSKGNWDNHLSFIEFTYKSYHLSISMEPFESLYGRGYRSTVWLFDIGESSLHCLEIIYEVLEKVRVIKYRLKTAYDQ